ncbi:MAG: YihY/virulence factor BrkB family protein [Lachnospiraceae bacterium]|nr:YihY/virulence factor BrkB family protein [Lachnospiraceae bacterium]
MSLKERKLRRMNNKLSSAMKKIFGAIKSFMIKSKEDSLSAYAAQTTFFIILSFVPILILLFIISSNVPNLWNNILRVALDVVPQSMHKYVYYIVDDIVNSSSRYFTIATVFLALWSSAKSVQALTYGLDRIYMVERKKGFIFTRLMSLVYMFVLLVLCVVAMIVDIFANQIFESIINQSRILINATIIVLSFRTLIMFIILFLLIWLIYYRLPARKGRFREEIYGAAVAAISLIVMTKLFSFYIKYISNMSYMYGGLTSVIVVIIWLYFCVQIVLFGAQINYFLNRRK